MGDDGGVRILEHMLPLLIELTKASGGAVWQVEGREGRLIRARDVDQAAMDRGRIARQFDQLRGGMIIGTDHALLPVRLHGSVHVLFYLASPRELVKHELEVARLLDQVAACLSAPAAEPSPARTSAVERRRALESLCEREDWCAARIARRLGISRPTLYRWLRNYGLERPGGPRRYPVRT